MPQRRDPSERFWEKVEKTETCWLWTAGAMKPPFDYGVFQLGRGEGVVRAHRYAWIESGKKIPEGLFLCHKCDIPRCVNPDHLFVGTAADNSRDMSEKGRAHESKRTHCPRGHVYDRVTVWRGKESRRCSICLKIQRHIHYLKNGN